MKKITIMNAILAVAIAVSPLLAAGQEPEPDKEKQKKEEPKKQPAQEPQGQEKEKPKPKEEKPKQEPAPTKQQKQDEKQQKQDEKKQKEQSQQRQSTGQNNRATSAEGHGGGQRIPEEKFRADFGREHHFRIAHRDDRRFQYGGFWFEAVQAWPADWSYQDDCYIEEDGDDYYLVDFVHPELRVLVIVVSA